VALLGKYSTEMVLASTGIDAPVKEYTPQLWKARTKNNAARNINCFFMINSLSTSPKEQERFMCQKYIKNKDIG
jgi:hypothetical protein